MWTWAAPHCVEGVANGAVQVLMRPLSVIDWSIRRPRSGRSTPAGAAAKRHFGRYGYLALGA